MSLERINDDILPVAENQASAGPRLGFLAGMEAAYDAAMRTSSLDGLAYHFRKLDDEQADKARKAGVEYTPLYMQIKGGNIDPDARVNDGTPQFRGFAARQDNYLDIARQYVDGAETPMSDALREQNQRIIKLNEENPDLKLQTITEMFGTLRQQAKSAVQRDTLDKSIGGYVGGFAGDVVAGVDPRTNLLNTVTLPLGSLGKGVATRILTQAGGQAAIETVNQITGVQENKRLLGLEGGVGDALFSIAGAAVGGAAIQGVAEAGTAALRRLRTGRWFEPTAKDPAPVAPEAPTPTISRVAATTPEFETAWAKAYPTESSPLSRTRFGVARAEDDMAHIARALDDWGGPAAADVKPPMITGGTEPLDNIARRVDPELFLTYDKLVKVREELRLQVRNPEEIAKLADDAAAANEVRTQIAELKRVAENAKGAKLARLQSRIDDLQATYDARFKDIPEGAPGTPEGLAADLRKQLMHADEQLRDLAPSVNRAYARAQNKWDVYDEQRRQIAEAIKHGDNGIGERLSSVLPEKMPDAPQPSRLHDNVAELRTTPLKPGETAAAAVQRVGADTAKLVDDTVDATREVIVKMPDAKDLPAERERLDKALETQTAKVAELKGKEKAAAQVKLEALEREREALDNYTVTIDGKEVKLELDGPKFDVDDLNGGKRQMTVRELLKEMKDDDNMLKAVTSCSLNATS